jgi:hypothetical protein
MVERAVIGPCNVIVAQFAVNRRGDAVDPDESLIRRMTCERMPDCSRHAGDTVTPKRCNGYYIWLMRALALVCAGVQGANAQRRLSLREMRPVPPHRRRVT